jgi:hypothetical protein
MRPDPDDRPADDDEEHEPEPGRERPPGTVVGDFGDDEQSDAGGDSDPHS